PLSELPLPAVGAEVAEVAPVAVRVEMLAHVRSGIGVADVVVAGDCRPGDRDAVELGANEGVVGLVVRVIEHEVAGDRDEVRALTADMREAGLPPQLVVGTLGAEMQVRDLDDEVARHDGWAY